MPTHNKHVNYRLFLFYSLLLVSFCSLLLFSLFLLCLISHQLAKLQEDRILSSQSTFHIDKNSFHIRPTPRQTLFRQRIIFHSLQVTASQHFQISHSRLEFHYLMILIYNNSLHKYHSYLLLHCSGYSRLYYNTRSKTLNLD
jgi:hypothetical protein